MEDWEKECSSDQPKEQIEKLPKICKMKFED